MRGARLGYGAHVVLERVDLALDAGAPVGLFGPNGGGKSTLLRALLGLLKPLAGDAHATRGAGYVPQRVADDPLIPVTCAEWIRAGARRRRAPVAELAARVGLGACLDTSLYALSGGEQRRAFLAHALAGEPAWIALDEPTAGVDAREVERLVALLADLGAKGTTLVFVTHDTELAALAERALWVADGRVSEIAPAEARRRLAVRPR
ncbi:MAG: ATP-binding cassette domain-containing protein [Planctomycetota bacterium]